MTFLRKGRAEEKAWNTEAEEPATAWKSRPRREQEEARGRGRRLPPRWRRAAEPGNQPALVTGPGSGDLALPAPAWGRGGNRREERRGEA